MEGPKVEDIKISGFVLTTNAITNQFPFTESIRSFLEICDEIVVVDGGSTDGTIEAIKKIKVYDGKVIRIVSDEDTKWEDVWSYSRMGHNFNRALQECTGDWVVKFDADYILKEDCSLRFRKELLTASNNNDLSAAFTRANFILADRYFVKSKKTLAVNITGCKKAGMDVCYGVDLARWKWGFDFVDKKFEENGLNCGIMVRKKDSCIITSTAVFNYEHMFMDIDTAKNARFRHHRAVTIQKNMKYVLNDVYPEIKVRDVTMDSAWKKYVHQITGNMNKFCVKLAVEQHPVIIQEKIKNLTKDKQGYDCWGLSNDKAEYYE